MTITYKPTKQSRSKTLALLELNPSIVGFSKTKCVTCTHSVLQAQVQDYADPEYVIPSERLTARQKHSKYSVVCIALNRDLIIGQVIECELHQEISTEESAAKVNSLPSTSIDFSRFKSFT